MTAEWKEDETLRDSLAKYVAEQVKREELVDVMRVEYPWYEWSVRTLGRRLGHFGIRYINYDTPLEDVIDAVQKEVNGPGKLLGYRALNTKLRMEHGIKVPRHLTHNVMKRVDPEGLESRRKGKKRKKRGVFSSDGPMYLLSLDGHDKMYGYQKWMYPLGVYGCLDTFSRKVIFLTVIPSNSDPDVIGNLFLNYLKESLILPNYLRVDRGTETGKMATMQTYLANELQLFDEPTDSVIYGVSTSNKIERFWRDLHERMELYFKNQLNCLRHNKEYLENVEFHREMVAYIYIPVLQRECDTFARYWNAHRIRHQPNTDIPAGIPNVLFSCPEREGYATQGTPITQEMIADVEFVSGLSSEVEDYVQKYMENELWELCCHYLPNPQELEGDDVMEAYRYLKHKIENENESSNVLTLPFSYVPDDEDCYNPGDEVSGDN